MSEFYLGEQSRENLCGVHTDLIVVVSIAIMLTQQDFSVLEGVRTLKRQKKLVRDGHSKTLKSRHLTGHAVDLGAFQDGTIIWAWPAYHSIAKAIMIGSERAGIPIEWGGDWDTFKDGPHFQLPRKEYP